MEKTQRILFKTIFWVSIVTLACFLSSFLIFKYLPIQWATNELKNSFEHMRFFGIPVCIMLTLFGTINHQDPIDSIGVKAGLTAIAAGISFFMLVGTVFDGLCQWTTREVLFEHVNDASRRIVERDLGCGAVDSGPPSVVVFEVREITPFLLRVERVDISQIDLREWRRKQAP